MSETFLSRWSRRKRAAATSPRLRGEVDARSASGEGGSPDAPTVANPPHPDPLPASGEREPAFGEREPPFDPASLPPIESIDAGTDVSAFLRPGVPTDLAQAALRRAWITDPAIRDFVGLAENAWDFTAPGGVPGFEPLRAIDDVQRLAAQVAGVLPAVAPEPAAREQVEGDPPEAETAAQQTPPATNVTSSQLGDAAAQKKNPTDES